MAKATGIARRVFFVRRNVDDVSAVRNMTTNPQKLLDFYEGEFYGAAGAQEEICVDKTPAFIRGWKMGNEAYDEALGSFEKAQAAGKKSAEARKAKNGTSQPNGGKGSTTKSRGYEDPRWQVLRLRIMERDGFKCSKCGNGERTLHVHHLKYTVGAQAWESPMEDLATLCDVCHADTHGK